MKIYPDTKVYVICPGNYNSGGPESLHQLCSQLISLNINAFMFYVPGKPKLFNPEDPVHETYKKYHLPYTFEVEDDEQNIIVITEAFSEYLYHTKKIQRIFWWLSVDIYIKRLRDFVDKRLLNPLKEPMPKLFYFYGEDDNIEFWGQSEYVRQFLYLNEVKNSINIETPMSQTFLRKAKNINFNKKKDIVAYNPKKGLEITEKLIAEAPDIDWQPIENMTPEQVQELLAAAKIYIDFGDFRGRERLPREAVLSGCVVITSRNGAAANDIDINIPAEFKFDGKKLNPKQVIKKIREVFENFDEAFESQKEFHDKELAAPQTFKTAITAAFEIKTPPPASVAFVQGVREESFLIAQGLFNNKNFKTCFIVDDILAVTDLPDERIVREQNRNYLRGGNNSIEIINRHDARFLYNEGRIKKFALLEPSDVEFKDLQAFYKPDNADVLIFSR